MISVMKYLTVGVFEHLEIKSEMDLDKGLITQSAPLEE